jgi:hypothetical protein
MSEPITLWTRDGEQVTLHSPAVARMAVDAGALYTFRPVVDVDADMPALDGMPGEDEQPVTEPKRKAGRPRKSTGVL